MHYHVISLPFFPFKGTHICKTPGSGSNYQVHFFSFRRFASSPLSASLCVILLLLHKTKNHTQYSYLFYNLIYLFSFVIDYVSDLNLIITGSCVMEHCSLLLFLCTRRQSLQSSLFLLLLVNFWISSFKKELSFLLFSLRYFRTR